MVASEEVNYGLGVESLHLILFSSLHFFHQAHGLFFKNKNRALVKQIIADHLDNLVVWYCAAFQNSPMRWHCISLMERETDD